MLVKNSLIIFPQLTINTINITSQLEPMLQAAQLIKKERPEIKFFLPVATGIDKKYVIWFS